MNVDTYKKQFLEILDRLMEMLQEFRMDVDAYMMDRSEFMRCVLTITKGDDFYGEYALSAYLDGFMDAVDLYALDDAYPDPLGEGNPDFRFNTGYDDACLGFCDPDDPVDFLSFKESVCSVIVEILYDLEFAPINDIITLEQLDMFRTRYRKYEVTSRDIPNLSDRKSQARSRSANIVARYQSFDKETGEIKYNVTSQSKAGKSYTVTFRMHDWKPDMDHLDDELQHAIKGNIEIDCTCPAFLYQGYKYIATMKGSSIDSEVRPPKETNPDRHGFACKHILKAIDSFNQDYDKFRAESKGLKLSRLRVKHSYE